MLELERQLGTQRGEIATIKGKLTASDEVNMMNTLQWLITCVCAGESEPKTASH